MGIIVVTRIITQLKPYEMSKLKLFLLSSGYDGYDEYDSIVVVAPNAGEARLYNPDEVRYSEDADNWDCYSSWPCNPKYVKVEYIGIAKTTYKTGTVIITSFNAG